MKKYGSGPVLIILYTFSNLLNAQTNSLKLIPDDEFATARSHVKQPELFKIATNTASFEAYWFNVMLVKANELRESWKLDVPKPLTVKEVVFSLQATPYGIYGNIGTRDGRYDWSFDRNALVSFSDCIYYPISFRYHDEQSARLAKIKSKINAGMSQKIAREALHQLGLTEKQLGLRDKPEVNQYQFEETDGTVYPLPCFNVAWYRKGRPKYFEDSNIRDTPVTMDISGITGTVVDYHNAEFYNIKAQLPRLPMPTNYFQMLGLPTNYLDTLPALRRKMLGLPPITNAPTAVTNLAK